jgi:hypothetical protein
MSYGNISAILEDGTFQNIKTGVKNIEVQMPFLVNLSGDEVHQLFKLGNKSAGFVQDALHCSINFPEVLSRGFDQEEFKRDATLFLQLSELQQVVRSLSEKLDDTVMAVGSESMNQALKVYAYAQTAEKSTPGLKTVVETMGERFKQKSAKTVEVSEN